MSFGGSGVKNWLLQRFTGIVIAAYTICFFYVVLQPGFDYQAWYTFNTCIFTKLFTLLTILSLCVHAWIGVWTICTDYLKCSCLRLAALFAVASTLIFCFGYNFYTIWSL